MPTANSKSSNVDSFSSSVSSSIASTVSIHFSVEKSSSCLFLSFRASKIGWISLTLLAPGREDVWTSLISSCRHESKAGTSTRNNSSSSSSSSNMNRLTCSSQEPII
ncbi:uncharacterized protein LOC133910769 [Phragmites australis]|uniref:uncharacterized protein LOC133910769 n=1 Tax=Phragmites australis TaxID=29695 RepID=UPI002D777D5A|nr:uncharacterized protein LOC133910769 [Phragmites australis]